MSAAPGFRLSVQQAECWRAGASALSGARGLFVLPEVATEAVVRGAISGIVARHEILRTRIATTAGAPLQFVEESPQLQWLGVMTLAAARAALMGSHPEGAPLAGAWVQEGTDGSPHLWLSVHGLNGDYATLGVVAAEVLASLNGASDGDDLPPVQYADYAQWQHELIEQEQGGAPLRPAQGAIPVARLPLQHGGAGAFEPRETLVADALACAEQEVFAAWSLLLARHVEQPRLAISIGDSGRSEEVSDACGPYARLLPLVLDVDPETDWRAWVHACQTARSRVLEWAELPAVDAALPDLHYHHTQAVPGQLVTGFEARFGLRLNVAERDGRMTVRLAWDASRLTDADVTEMTAQFRALLDRLPGMEGRIGTISLAHGETTDRQSRSATTFPVPDGRLLHDLVARAARDHGGRPAVRCGDATLSYDELEARAGELAGRLMHAGAAPDRIVGLCIERSVDLIVGILAILKAGAAYLPLDPHYPPDRLAYMLDDSGASIVLTSRAMAPRLPEGISIIEMEAVAAPATAIAGPRPHPDQLAYVIYTSGSTGRPKGVTVTHRNAVQSTLARHHWYERPVTAYLLLSSSAFDSSVAGIFWTLSQAAMLVLPQEDVHRDVTAFARLVEDNRISHLLALPSLYGQLLAEEGGRLGSLSDVIVAGEACTASLVDAHHAGLPGTALSNEYGPTEASVWSSAHHTSPGEEVVPIGRPLPHVGAWVLDDRLNLLPDGLAGELYLAGPALARGYHDRPALTAERFVPHPHAVGERLYRTGDRVRMRSDGRLLFLGRTDQQIKIRGFRIELGEIEARLAEHAGVAEAVASVREDDGGDRQIVAYVVPTRHPGGPVADVAGLRNHLARALPEYLIPSAYVVLDSVPLTPNGKVDRNALPAPDPATRTVATPPRTLTETLVAAVWADVLGIDQIDVHDNFFELGGHSLIATQVISRLKRSLSIDLPVKQLFAAPTIAGLSAAIERLIEAGSEGPEETAITVVPRDAPIPLSFAQQRLWFLTHLDPEDCSYHIPGLLTLRGTLDVAALAAAFEAVQRHHEILRTSFPAGRDGQPVQQVNPVPSAVLERRDLLPGADVEAVAQQEVLRPFTLASGALMRAVLLRENATTHHLILVLHHIIADGWSTERLLQDWTELYAQAVAGQPLELRPLAIQYADYAAWQRDITDEALIARELGWWRETLGDVSPLLALPTDRPRPAAVSGRGGRVQVMLPAGLATSARRFAHRNNATLFMLLESVFAALLHRHSGQDDIRVGTPVAGRDGVELEPVLGLFINTMVLRHDFSAARSFATILGETRQLVLDAHQHRHLPFERLVDALVPQRDLSHSPLFQAMFDMQTERYAALDGMPGLQVDIRAIDMPTSKFDLSLTAVERGDGLELCFEYATDLFDADRIERLADHYGRLLDAALSAPDRPMADLPLLDRDEQERLGAVTLPARPADDCFVTLFAQQAGRTPDALAVDDGRTSYSYAQLHERAQALATRLRAAGAGPDHRVAILLPRSSDYLVAILGSLLSGAAWLPLDPVLPTARLQQMIGQVAPVAILCSGEDDGRAAEIGSALDSNVMRIAVDQPPGAAFAGMPPVHPEQLAYVIFTSGSTGTPKGAMVTQAGMLNTLLRKQEQLALKPGDRVAQTASPCFDISVWQFLAALLCGASVEIIADETARDPAALMHAVNERGIVVLQSVPSQIRGMLTDPDAPVALPGLRCLLPTGEALTPDLATRWFARFPDIPLLNTYGPAECADDVAVWTMMSPPCEGQTHLPIGTAVAHLGLSVVNGALQMQPPGVTGELAVAGVGVGRGYLGDPATTAERFLPDPRGAPGSRLYRSGDLVRQDIDGVLSFLGRSDHQVKIRGYRVEPGEVEMRLSHYPGITAATVMMRGDPPRLVAYLEAGEPIDSQAVRSFVGAYLPDYMVPSLVVVLRAFPLNANGKVDRARLPDPGEDWDRVPDDAAEQAATPNERVMQRVWQQVLGLPHVGLHDNFFALGGDSILSIQLVAKAREAGLRFSTRTVFQHQSVSALAAIAEWEEPAMAHPAPVGELPLTPIQQDFFALDMGNPHHWNQSLLLTPSVHLDGALVRRTLAALVAHHDALRLRFRRTGDAGDWAQSYADVETADLLMQGHIDRAEALMPACDVVQASLDIEQGPLVRGGLFDLVDGGQRLLIALHHLVVDGLSLRILLDDFATVYAGLKRGEEPGLPARTASYQQWSRGLAARAAAGEADGEKGYWQQQRAEPLPVEWPEGRRLERDIAILHLELDEETTGRMLSGGSGRTRADAYLLAALASVLTQWSGNEAIVIEQEGHGRPEGADIMRTVGWFTAAYPLRIAMPRGASPAGQLRHVKQCLQAVPGQDGAQGIGYGMLHRLHGAVPTAEPQIAFNYLGQFDASMTMALFQRLDPASGQLYDPDTPRRHEFDLNCYVLGGQLRIDWGYSRERYGADTMAMLAGRLVDRIRDLVAALDTDTDAHGDLLTPADFPDSDLDEDTLSHLLEGME